MSTRIPIVVTAVLILAACGRENNNTLFTRLDGDQTGIKFQNTLFEDGPLNVANYIYFYNGGGVAIGDINNDGLQDILFTGNMVRNRLYLNKGNFRFEDITEQSGVDKFQGWCTGATMVDINHDGLLDIYICRSADIRSDLRRNLLFINNGNLSFTERAYEYGLADSGYSTQAAFFDYDKDGDLDCFIINHSLQKYTAGIQDNPEIRKEHNPDFACKLYRNDNNHFKNVSDSAGITSNVLTFGLGLAITDFNNDGWPDVYVSNDFNEPDYLFMNNRNGTFTEQLRFSMDDVSLYSMGSDAADYDNDGRVDLLTLDMLPEDNRTIKMHSGPDNFDKFQYLFNKGYYYQYSRNMLQKNNGDGTFSEVGQLAGVSNTDWSWSALFADYDNDGYKDLFVSNGYVKDYTEMDFLKYSVDRVVRTMHKDSVDPIPEYIKKMPTNVIPNYIFRNQGNGTFVKKTDEWGMNQKGVSAGAAYADLDNDGDLDLVINNSNEEAGIYRNNEDKIERNNYLRVRLKGNPGNSRGIGAKVYLYCGNRMNYQEQSPVRGFQSSSDPVLNFGTGKDSLVDSVVVIWPDNRMQKLTGVQPNREITFSQAEANREWKPVSTSEGEKIFRQSSLEGANHQENNFNDFTVQQLLPNYLSRQGPCIAVGDIDKNGLEDFYQGGAKGFSGGLFMQNRDGSFTKRSMPAFDQDAGSEDISATFFDADGDGNLDLYVVSGGYEFGENDAALQDRLYVNDGKGNFIKKQDALPAMHSSKSCVAVADLDGDGDLDLFVGGRVIPGKYPAAPRSYILMNDGKGKFTDQTNEVCPALLQPGMVTDALWTDINGDKKPDLVVVGEWMPVKVFLNNGGKLQDVSTSYIPFASTGWWNTIQATDMDGDGDEDLVIGNCGLNTQFRVSDKEPMTLVVKDFDGNGSPDPILCYYINGVSYPAASRDDLTEQIPALKKKFLEYWQYANASLSDIFTKEELSDARVLKAETMETIYLENQGPKGYVLHRLPLMAQEAPVYGIAMDDFDHDGKKDILLAGNNTWTRIKFGRYAANHGLLLKGDGKGSFECIPSARTGLMLRGNTRALKELHNGNKIRVLAGINNDNTQILTIQ